MSPLTEKILAIVYKLSPSFTVSPKKDIGATDDDTIKIEQPVRMVSCDTPEKEKPFGGAAKKHIEAGRKASDQFEKIKNQRHNLRNGKRRKVGELPSGEMIDSRGRMLAYITTFLTKNIYLPRVTRNGIPTTW